jgi:hypothetical protein
MHMKETGSIIGLGCRKFPYGARGSGVVDDGIEVDDAAAVGAVADIFDVGAAGEAVRSRMRAERRRARRW